MEEKITRGEALKRIFSFVIGVGIFSFFAKKVFADVIFKGADFSTGTPIEFIHYDYETGLLTIGKAGDIILGDSTLRVMYPQTTAKIDLGNGSNQFNDAFFDGTVQTDALRIDEGGSTTISTGVGSVKMSSTNAATNTVWIRISYNGTNYYVPGWTTNSP